MQLNMLIDCKVVHPLSSQVTCEDIIIPGFDEFVPFDGNRRTGVGACADSIDNCCAECSLKRDFIGWVDSHRFELVGDLLEVDPVSVHYIAIWGDLVGLIEGAIVYLLNQSFAAWEGAFG
jgi:hypothetical protein